MMALQKSLMEQTDIVPVLKNFNVQVDDSGELVIMNPPVVKADKGTETDVKHSRVVTS
jgi:tRNA1(Val) A37 N6-methylase TrmN6